MAKAAARLHELADERLDAAPCHQRPHGRLHHPDGDTVESDLWPASAMSGTAIFSIGMPRARCIAMLSIDRGAVLRIEVERAHLVKDRALHVAGTAHATRQATPMPSAYRAARRHIPCGSGESRRRKRRANVPAPHASSSNTLWPLRCRFQAVQAPKTPAPITMKSHPPTVAPSPEHEKPLSAPAVASPLSISRRETIKSARCRSGRLSDCRWSTCFRFRGRHRAV